MTHILAIQGSYREGGATDQAVDTAVRAAEAAGAKVEVVRLREVPIEFCRNCRQCTQTPGEAPGQCVHDDAMRGLVGRIEAADAYILASPTNVWSVTAVFKRFMERLIVYAYWPWGAKAPVLRKRKAPKKAMLIAVSAAPGLMGRLFFKTLSQLRMTAKTIGAHPVSSTFIGLMSQEEHPQLSEKTRQRLRGMAEKLVA
jgi:multimeric flavodoxin WrbA